METATIEAGHSAQNTANPVGELVPLPQRFEDRYTRLSLAEIHPNPDQPRRHFDDDDLADLAQSIHVHGMQQPINVRHISDPFNEDGPGFYQIIAGERRYRAAKMLGMEKVPVIVKDVDTDVEAIELALIENKVRANLNPIEEGEAYKRLTEMGQKQETIAARIGVKQELISRRIGLLRLPDMVQVHIAGGKMSATHGVILLGISDYGPDIVERFARDAMGEEWSTARLGDAVKVFLAEQEAARKADQEKQQPRLLDTPAPAPAPAAKNTPPTPPAAKPTIPPAPAPTPEPPKPFTDEDDGDNTDFDLDADSVGAPTEEDDALDPIPAAAPAAVETPAPVPAPSAPATGPARDIKTETITTGTGERLQMAMLQSDDDWLFEEGLTIDQVFAHLRTQWPYRLTSIGRKILKALTDGYNDENPDDPITPAVRLEALLMSKAQEAGLNINALQEIPE